MFTGLGNPLLLDSKGWVGEWGVVRSIWKAFSQGCSESSGRWWIRVLWIKAFKAERWAVRPFGLGDAFPLVLGRMVALGSAGSSGRSRHRGSTGHGLRFGYWLAAAAGAPLDLYCSGHSAPPTSQSSGRTFSNSGEVSLVQKMSPATRAAPS